MVKTVFYFFIDFGPRKQGQQSRLGTCVVLAVNNEHFFKTILVLKAFTNQMFHLGSTIAK